ncbi:hypothetical protein GGR57DRAFT_395503 [Xylariaceae sp. FL1272]|nr:hypothetical protein GGR57DRAFT_395503 [Xylariaceae sp. FL1272]
MAPPCKFFQWGTCRNGAECRFDHSVVNTNQTSNSFGPSNNRFNALSNTNSTRGAEDLATRYKISKDLIKTDLTTELPQWILSSYGPGRDAPEQLFGGYPREQSFEEIRLHVQSATNPQQAQQRVQP